MKSKMIPSKVLSRSMRKANHMPLRRCVGCREMKPQKSLLRIVKLKTETVLDGNKNEQVEFLVNPKSPQGRSAYLCCDASCLTKAYKAQGFQRSFKQQISDGLYEELKEIIER